MDTQGLVNQILRADGASLDAIAKALTVRYNTLFPDHEVIYLALPKNDLQERQRLLQMVQDLV